MPRLSSPSPRSAPIITTHFPPPPAPAPFPSYPWSNHSHNPGWDSREVTVDWYDCQDLLQQAEQLRARTEFVKQQKEREEYERQHEKEELARQQQEKEEHAKQIAKYKQFLEKAKQQQEREEYERFKNKEDKKLLQEAKQQQEREEYERFKNNITSVINKKITENQYEEIPDAPAPDFHDHKLHVRMPGDFKPLVEKPTKQSRQPLFNRAPGTERHTVLGKMS